MIEDPHSKLWGIFEMQGSETIHCISSLTTRAKLRGMRSLFIFKPRDISGGGVIMCNLKCLLLTTLLLLCSIPLQAKIIHVPDGSSTIQAGIQGAAGGDTVMVSPGTYHEHDIDFLGKGITVMGTDPADSAVVAATVVDADSLGRVFVFQSGENRSSILSGLTITQGRAEVGGGIFCFESRPVITHCIITGNSSFGTEFTQGGGGIGCRYSEPLIKGNIITANTAANRGNGIYCYRSRSEIRNNSIVGNLGEVAGGGIYWYNYNVTIVNNIISGNSAYEGGGIYVYEIWGEVSGNTIVENVASRRGGGICGGGMTITNNTISRNHGGGIYGVSDIIGNTISDNIGHGIHMEGHGGENRVIMNNLISGNSTGGEGGGVRCYQSRPVIAHNVITRNSAGGGGGGISSANTQYIVHPIIINNTISANTAEEGGGVWCVDTNPDLINNTIVGNTATRGGGFYCGRGAPPDIISSILWGNDASEGPQIWVGGDPDPSELTISYSDVQGGRDSVYLESGGTLWWSQGMIDADPAFVFPELGDYRLLWHIPFTTNHSPCIDTGHPDSLDADGTRSDMGAHFFNQDDYLTIYMTPDATEIEPGGQLGVTYTLINRWVQREPFWLRTETVLPDGSTRGIIGPTRYELPLNNTVRRRVVHQIPGSAPPGRYGYTSQIGFPPGSVYDKDSFGFDVVH